MEQSEKEKIRRMNCKGDLIHRNENECFYPISTPTHSPRVAYPWEAEGRLPRITKDFFRCKGKSSHPPLFVSGNFDPIVDCEGALRHGLPIFKGKEDVYPILVDLLNYIQKKTGRRVIVTCGHRCPAHNSYADPSKENRTSKHQIGAEVDFYVQGMEDRPLEIVGLAMQYYQEMPAYGVDKEYLEFRRYDRPDARSTIQPWFNKELFITLFQKEEGRDADNSHPHPYISFQVRFDREGKERVVYSWERAHRGYPRG